VNETSTSARDSREPSIRSLADIRRGETVRIEGILFGALRELCRAIGIEEGDDVRCRGTSRGAVLLETPVRRTALLEMDWARFIQISADAPASPTRPTGRGPARAIEHRDARLG